jgi:hypothetical protein
LQTYSKGQILDRLKSLSLVHFNEPPELVNLLKEGIINSLNVLYGDYFAQKRPLHFSSALRQERRARNTTQTQHAATTNTTKTTMDDQENHVPTATESAVVEPTMEATTMTDESDIARSTEPSAETDDANDDAVAGGVDENVHPPARLMITKMVSCLRLIVM